MRPLHANRQIGNTFDIEPQDICLYMNELASLLALERLTLAGISEARYLSLPFSSPRHACKASRRRSRGSHILLPKWSPRGHDRGFYFTWASVVLFMHAQGFFFHFLFSLIGTPLGDRHDISVHSLAHLSAVRARSQEARKFSSFDHIHLSRKWRVRPSEQKTRKFCSMS